MDEASLLDKLRKIEALHSGATTDGERDAASAAAERIRERLRAERGRDRDIELKYSIADPWQRQLFIALCRRYDLVPFRYPRQRRSTIVVRAPERFQRETLYPQWLELARELHQHLSEVAERVIRQAIHTDASDAPEQEPRALAPVGDRARV